MLKLLLVHISMIFTLVYLSVNVPLYVVSKLSIPLKKSEVLAEKVVKKVEVKKTNYKNYIPKSIVKVEEAAQQTTKIVYSVVKKEKVNLALKNETKKITSSKKTFKSTQIEDNAFELSLSDIELKDNTIKMNMIKKLAWSKITFPTSEYSKSLIAKTQDNVKDENEDRISTIAAAAEEKSTSEPILTKNDIDLKQREGDELVFFDYSEDGKVKAETEEVVLSEESPTIKEGISDKKISKTTITTQMKLNSQKEAPAKKIVAAAIKDISSSKKVASYEGPKKSQEEESMYDFAGSEKSGFVEAPKDYGCLNQKDIKRSNYKNEYSISLNSIRANTQKISKVHNFEVRFQDDIDDIVQDFGEGEIHLNYLLTTEMNIRRGIAHASGHYPTAMDFVFEGDSASYSIPVFEKDTFDQLVSDLEVPGLGGHLLVELDDNTEDVELDVKTKYDAKVYLNANLKVVSREDSDYSFIMFIGVESGNTIVNFRNQKNQVSNKIIHLTAHEILYEPNFYAHVKSEKVEFYEEGLRSKCLGLLDIPVSKITPWSFNGQIKKNTLNSVSIENMIYPLGTRKYFELNHFDKSIFVGHWSEAEVIIPDAEYADNILNNFDVADNECMIQLNVTKSIKELNVNAISKNNYTAPVIKFLDSDGSFYANVSDKTNRIFIHGQEQGLVNIKLEYIDGSKQFIQTYCSEDTYLVEQL